jgi:uncharacterized protein YcbK (DUF882 family)
MSQANVQLAYDMLSGITFDWSTYWNDSKVKVQYTKSIGGFDASSQYPGYFESKEMAQKYFARILELLTSTAPLVVDANHPYVKWLKQDHLKEINYYRGKLNKLKEILDKTFVTTDKIRMGVSGGAWQPSNMKDCMLMSVSAKRNVITLQGCCCDALTVIEPAASTTFYNFNDLYTQLNDVAQYATVKTSAIDVAHVKPEHIDQMIKSDDSAIYMNEIVRMDKLLTETKEQHAEELKKCKEDLARAKQDAVSQSDAAQVTLGQYTAAYGVKLLEAERKYAKLNEETTRLAAKVKDAAGELAQAELSFNERHKNNRAKLVAEIEQLKIDEMLQADQVTRLKDEMHVLGGKLREAQNIMAELEKENIVVADKLKHFYAGMGAKKELAEIDMRTEALSLVVVESLVDNDLDNPGLDIVKSQVPSSPWKGSKDDSDGDMGSLYD